MMDPNMRKIESLKAKIMPLVNEMKSLQAINDSLEAGIVNIIGFHVFDLVKKVIEPTGATGKDGKPIKVTKYLPTDMVSYDEQKKQYVIHIPSTYEINTKLEAMLAEEQKDAESLDFHEEEPATEVSEDSAVAEPATEEEKAGDDMSWNN